MMKCSLIIPALESYEVVRRQIVYMQKMPLPDNFEVIFVDDGSDPPLMAYLHNRGYGIFPDPKVAKTGQYKVVATNDFRPWTQACAVNFGVEHSEAEYVLCTAVDHFVSKEQIEAIANFTGDKMVFPRIFATLSKHGEVRTDEETLTEYGWVDAERAKGKGTGAGYGLFLMKRILFNLMTGYDEDHCGKYGKDDVDLSKRYSQLCQEKKATPHKVGPSMYVYPAAAADLGWVFHGLRRRKRR